jgi:hypothetical protein
LAGTTGDYIPLSTDSSGNLRVTSTGGGGAGTEYTEGDTDTTITGTALLWEDTSDTLRAVSASKPLPVNIISGAGSGGTAMADDSAFTVGTSNVTPAAGTYRATRDSVDDGDIGAFAMTPKRAQYVALETPNGDSAMDDTNDAVRVNLVTGSALPVTDNGSTLSVDDGGGSLTVDGSVAATQSGTWTLGANSGVDIGDVTINNASGASAVNIQDGGNSITVDGTVTANAGTGTFATNVSQVGGNSLNTGTGNASTGTQRVVLASDQPTVSVTQKPATSGGLSAYRNLDMGSTGAVAKSSAGQVFGWFIGNKHATDFRFVKLYNKSTTPSSSDTPLMTLAIPPMAGANVEFTNGIAFSSGIGVRATTGVADSDTGAPTTNDVIVNLLYS